MGRFGTSSSSIASRILLTPMHEYPLPNDGKIWNVKWQHCGPSSLNSKLHETSVQELTSLDLRLEPLFENAWRSHFESLWLPTEIGF